MKKLFAPLVLLFCIGVMVSCSKKDPVAEPDPEIINAQADFEITPGDDPFTFDYKNLSSKYKRIEWRFGDDTLSTAENPSHVYLTTGKYTVDLRVYSETGAVSRKVANLDVNPDAIAKIKSTPSGANKVNFSVESIADVVKAEWSISDDSRAGNPVVTKSTELTPTFTVPAGRIAPITLKLTTAKGSSATLVKNSSTEGLVTNFMINMVKYTPSADNVGNANERAVKLFDNANSKFLVNFNDVGRSWNIVMEFSEAHRMKFYCIGNGNDAPNRDPKEWKIEGSNDNANWTLVDSRNQAVTFTQQLLDRGFQNNDNDLDWKKFYFAASTPGSYKYYRMTVINNFNNDSLIQFGEISLFE